MMNFDDRFLYFFNERVILSQLVKNNDYIIFARLQLFGDEKIYRYC